MTDVGRKVYEALWSGRSMGGQVAFGDVEQNAVVTVKRSMSGRIELIVDVEGQRELAYLESDGKLQPAGTAAEDDGGGLLLASQHVEGSAPEPFVRVKANGDERRLPYQGPPVSEQKPWGRPTS